jgi:hypothetical protein
VIEKWWWPEIKRAGNVNVVSIERLLPEGTRGREGGYALW